MKYPQCLYNDKEYLFLVSDPKRANKLYNLRFDPIEAHKLVYQWTKTPNLIRFSEFVELLSYCQFNNHRYKAKTTGDID